ncbi:hypothetical protein GQ600_931 [Phytophthora cactorum]|nr:hypothetical protein GQ600_931 [Phytophthora cactorum]
MVRHGRSCRTSSWHLGWSSINGHEVGHKARVWTEKELAWLKKKRRPRRTNASRQERGSSAVRSEASDGKSYNTVKLLYSLASYAPQPPQLFSFNSSRSRAEVEEQPPQIFASKLGQFLGAGSARTMRSPARNRRVRCLNTAGTRLPGGSCWPPTRAEAVDSSTQAANDSSDSFDTYSVLDIPSSHPRADVAPTVRDSFKAFASGRDLRDTLAASNNLVADCGLDGVKLQEPWHVYYHIRGAVYSKLSFRHKQLFRVVGRAIQPRCVQATSMR